MLITNTKLKLTSFVIFLCLLLPIATVAQTYHVVVGAFAIENNARKFTGYVRSKFYNAHYEQNLTNKLFYVYVLKSGQRDAAYQQAKQLQTESEFKDTWVYAGPLGTSVDVAQQPIKPAPPEITSPLVEKEPETAKTETKEPEAVEIADVPDTLDAPEIDPKKTVPAERKVKGKLFKFVIQTPTGKPVQGEVHQVDYSRGKDIATYRTGELIDVLPPAKTNNPMTLVCGIFGYKEVIREIDYRNPASGGAVRDENGAWVVDYPLEPLDKGDVSVMYRVAFYKDAVVMLPVSKVELDQLVALMNANPNYRIKIHGHCNGNHSRRIIALGPTKNYFNIKGSAEINGSAKELSELRAKAVQMYLLDAGIEKSRTDIFGWAGTNMLVDERSTSAKLNDRIEIEIIKD